LLCGKIASGKSTLVDRLGRCDRTVVIAEDAWLNTLFGGQMTSVQDYLHFSAQLRAAMAPHVVALLNAGVSVVLDFPANTVATRAWMRSILDRAGVAHEMHVLDVPDAVCIARLHARNARGNHPFAASEAQFHQLSRHFEAPTEVEGFNIVMHRHTED
jgi:predicted kinase